MSKRCELTGISPLKGHNVSHAKNKTKRRFLPNLKKVTFRSDILKKDIKLNVANAALRTVDFKGGLDKFLISAKNAKLSKKSKKNKSIYFSKILILNEFILQTLCFNGCNCSSFKLLGSISNSIFWIK